MIPLTKNTWGLKKIKFLAYPEAKLLHEEVLDLLQPVQHVLDLLANLRPRLLSQLIVHNPEPGAGQ